MNTNMAFTQFKKANNNANKLKIVLKENNVVTRR